MKQVYSKPTLIMESFVMTQSIAATCNVVAGGGSTGKPAFSSKSSCGWDVGNMVVFVESIGASVCDYDVGEEDEVFGMCYNNPNPNNALFGS